jgi:hypothetical protein
MLAVAVLTSTPRADLQRAGADLFADEAGALTVSALIG